VEISKTQNELGAIIKLLDFGSHGNKENVIDDGNCNIFEKRKLADCHLESWFHTKDREHTEVSCRNVPEVVPWKSSLRHLHVMERIVMERRDSSYPGN